jgi:photosystem II stability/assembly factor-like uncharacterized protein
MPRKNVLLPLLAFLAVSLCAGGQGSWTRIPVPTAHTLKSMSFPDTLHGWVSGDSGTILHTADAGRSWQPQDGHIFNDVEDIFFLDSLRGWASAFNYTVAPYGTILLKTRNGGKTWDTSTYSEENTFITSVFFLDTLHGWMGGKPNLLVKTNDGGATWHHGFIDTSALAFFPVLSVRFHDLQRGYACGGIHDVAGVTWRTTDGGDSWSAISTSEAPADEIHDMYLFDAQRVIGAGGDPDFGYGVGLLKTNNGGVSWEYQTLAFQGNTFDIDFRTPREAWAPLGPQQAFIWTTDTGATWQQVSTPDSEAIFRVAFPDSLHGFACGQKGAMLKFIPPINPGVPPVPGHAAGMIVAQNYPNPFTGRTEIEVSLTRSQRLLLSVFDVTGRKVLEQDAGQISAGKYRFTVSGNELSPGIYWYRVSGEEGSVTCKMVRY